jgi:hypothetical protein
VKQDADGNYLSASAYGTAGAGEVDPDNFVAFDSVTKDWCKERCLLHWVKQKLNYRQIWTPRLTTLLTHLSYKNTFSLERIMTEKNVITINGKEYEESTMDGQQLYLINQIRDLQTKAGSLRFQLDQVQVAQDAFTTALIQSVEKGGDEDEAAIAN